MTHRISCLLGLLMAFCGPAAAATFTTLPQTQPLESFGAPPDGLPYFGQVFTAPGGTLQSWTVNLAAADAGRFSLVVQAWDAINLEPTGSVLVASGPATGIPGDFADYTFGGLGLVLAAGFEYLAYITTDGLSTPLGASTVAGSDTPSALGGQAFVWDGVNDGWLSAANYQLGYTAVFANVPSPAGLALFVPALLGLAVVTAIKAAKRAALAPRVIMAHG